MNTPPFRYYVAFFHGAVPGAAPLETNVPLDNAPAILAAAEQMRLAIMRQARAVRSPPLVIVSIIPCREPGSPITPGT